MTYRSRAGGPLKTHKKQGIKNGGRGKLHHPPPPSAQADPSSSSSSAHPALSSPSDEAILASLRTALSSTLSSPDFRSTIQRIKALLYDSKWLEVFTDPELLEAYAGRWVPSRALCFRELMVHLPEVREMMLGKQREEADSDDSDGEEEEEDQDEEEEEEQGDLRVVSLGGGAGSELAAVASLLAYRKSSKGKEKACEWVGADIGKWGDVLAKIGTAAQGDFDLDSLTVNYVEGNLLSAGSQLLSRIFSPTSATSSTSSPAPTLYTLLFTLTELLSQSPSSTISLLRFLTSQSPPGTLLLVADSASDIASFSLGSERKWPTMTVIDLVMLRMLAGTEGPAWELVRSEDSRWYRLGEGVGADWPVKLENTRYWYRLFRRI
ncbi:putative cytoplasm protein [Dioszegia hungarica]|uniref:Cytoplasm protein n=1 Tax=Dioszegia hungarica TaxID=4972 RepID=A0AA38H3Y3_9TREE|nr:putative cytoplasm protein [Dioszegia hungarica]KAI9631749.1 putative cytoplasm protein [Dioszegia hungarica]